MTLEPCPFCGGEARYTNSDHGPFELVECDACGAKGPEANYNHRESGEALWNSRAALTGDQMASCGRCALWRKPVEETVEGKNGWGSCQWQAPVLSFAWLPTDTRAEDGAECRTFVPHEANTAPGREGT